MAESSAPKRVDPADIAAELEKIVGSDTFARSERSRELLRYLVEQDLAGNADRLKGFAIALDVFGRDSGFDPSTDAVVRVQAGRLRDMVAAYYDGEGKHDRVRITVPRGSYVPLYEEIAEDPELDAQLADATTQLTPAAFPHGLPPIPGPGAPSSRAEANLMILDNIRRFWFALAAIVLMLAVILVMLIEGYVAAPQPPAVAAGGRENVPGAGLIPTIAFIGSDEVDEAPAILGILEDALPRFDSVNYISEVSGGSDAPPADFDLRLLMRDDGNARLQLIHRESGVLVSSGDISLPASQEELRNSVSDILSRMVPVGGSLYGYLESEALLNPLTECLALTSAYFNRQSEERHARAMQCHEGLIEDGVASGLVYADLSSLEVEAVSDGYAYPPNASLEDALVRARRAVELSPLSAYAHRSLERVLSRMDEETAAIQASRQAYELNPYDLNIAASYGNSLLHVGDFKAAADVLEGAVSASPTHPVWWDYALFIAAYLDGRRDVAIRVVTNLVGEDRPHYEGAKLIVADMTGDEKRKAELIAQLKKLDSAYVRDPIKFYARTLPREAAQRMAAALGKAGLDAGETSAN